MRVAAWWIGLVGSSLLAGCAARGGGAGAGEPGLEEIDATMRAHFSHIERLEEAIVRGDVSAARDAGEALAAEAGRGAFPGDAAASAARLRDLGERVSRASDADGAGALLGELALECGSCHAERREGPEAEAPPPPPAWPTLPAHMRRHAWAAARMGEAIVEASEDTWIVGALTLTDAPFTPERMPSPLAPSPLAELAVEVHELGLSALEAGSWSARADLYGRLVTTCARCHELVGAEGGG